MKASCGVVRSELFIFDSRSERRYGELLHFIANISSKKSSMATSAQSASVPPAPNEYGGGKEYIYF